MFPFQYHIHVLFFWIREGLHAPRFCKDPDGGMLAIHPKGDVFLVGIWVVLYLPSKQRIDHFPIGEKT